jgi:hypothetical protein
MCSKCSDSPTSHGFNKVTEVLLFTLFVSCDIDIIGPNNYVNCKDTSEGSVRAVWGWSVCFAFFYLVYVHWWDGTSCSDWCLERVVLHCLLAVLYQSISDIHDTHSELYWCYIAARCCTTVNSLLWCHTTAHHCSGATPLHITSLYFFYHIF